MDVDKEVNKILIGLEANCCECGQPNLESAATAISALITRREEEFEDEMNAKVKGARADFHSAVDWEVNREKETHKQEIEDLCIEHCKELEEFDKERVKEVREAREEGIWTGIGWAHTDACVILEKGGDPRKIIVPEQMERASVDLELKTTQGRGE